MGKVMFHLSVLMFLTGIFCLGIAAITAVAIYPELLGLIAGVAALICLVKVWESSNEE